MYAIITLATAALWVAVAALVLLSKELQLGKFEVAAMAFMLAITTIAAYHWR